MQVILVKLNYNYYYYYKQVTKYNIRSYYFLSFALCYYHYATLNGKKKKRR
jgi:hypothetical protein